jgi:SAM-dependent methyltransferase
MTARQPGVDTDPIAMWSPALARGLIRDEIMRSMCYRDGYTDLIGYRDPPRHGSVQEVVSATVASISERVWRSLIRALLRIAGVPIPVARQWVGTAVRIGGKERVLDVACGPGHDTAFLAGQLDGSGFVIGVDASAPMMRRAVRANSGPRAVYMRADTRSLPFNDGAFDVVFCLAGLHMSAEPMAVLHEMVRVLAPGGRIAVFTSYGGQSVLARKGIELAAAICGVRVFDRTTIPAFLRAAGLMDIEQHLRGVSQFVSARWPELPAELNQGRTRSTVPSARWRPAG